MRYETQNGINVRDCNALWLAQFGDTLLGRKLKSVVEAENDV